MKGLFLLPSLLMFPVLSYAEEYNLNDQYKNDIHIRPLDK